MIISEKPLKIIGHNKNETKYEINVKLTLFFDEYVPKVARDTSAMVLHHPVMWYHIRRPMKII